MLEVQGGVTLEALKARIGGGGGEGLEGANMRGKPWKGRP